MPIWLKLFLLALNNIDQAAMQDFLDLAKETNQEIIHTLMNGIRPPLEL